ncbi:protein kinase [Streptomyces sp. NPDC041068]|uniref:protein kinase domain-containing protein n=1 Tax=Streptomyces sp. NPDC041068 TaxID=3155130 RepID=UPI0033C8F7A3
MTAAPPSGSPLLPSDPRTIGGHRVVGRLGAGGMGQVYLARSPGGRLVAVKTVHEHLAADPHFRERFRREATAARAVTGAHTAAVLDADPDSPVPWLATAFLPGITLSRAVSLCPTFGADAVRSLGAHLAEALTSIHAAGIVHRDLKPSNVLLTADGPRVIDFGISRAAGTPGLTEAGAMIGTPGFMAPEQIGGGEVGPATDVFALGAVLAHAASGEHPFGSGPVAVLLYRATHEEPHLDGVPEASGLRRLVTACLDKDPARRPSVADVLARTSSPDAPLWWREEPLRSLISGEAPPQKKSPPQKKQEVYDTTRALTRDQHPHPAEHPYPADRRRPLARRTLLGAIGAGFAGLVGWILTRPRSEAPAAAEDGLRLVTAKGARRAGKARWTLTAEPGGGLDAFLLSGSTVLVHAKQPYTSTEGHLRAVAATDGARRWRAGTGADAPTSWGVGRGMLIAPDHVPRALALRDGDPWEPKDAWPGPVRWFAAAGRRLVALVEGQSSGNDFTLRFHTLPTGSSPRTVRTPFAWHRPAVSGSTLLLAPTAGSYTTECVLLDAETGRQRPVKEGPGGDEPAVTAPATLPARGGRPARFALLTEESELHLLDVRTGEPVGRGRIEVTTGAGTTALGYAFGTGLLLAGGRHLLGFDPADGKELWRFGTAGLDMSWRRRAGGGHAPVAADGVLLHWTDAKTLQAIDVDKGKELWRTSFDDTARCPPAVGGGLVYVGAGRLCRALTLRGGERRGQWTLAEPAAELAADDDGWYARLGDASLRAVNAP